MTEKPSCTAITRSGRPCRNRPVRGDRRKSGALSERDSDPPRCAVHGGRAAPAAGGGDEREAPSLEVRIAELDARIAAFGVYIDDRQGKLKPEEITSLLDTYGQLVSRLGRLMRDQRALSGEAADGISGAIAQALDELATLLGADL